MIHVRVGSERAALILGKLLEPEQRDGLVDLRASSPSSSLYSSVRTLLVQHEPVALVLDADSTETATVDRVREEPTWILGKPVPDSFQIFVAVPGLEALLFHRPEAIRRAYPDAPERWVELGQYNPGIALQKIEPSGDRPQASLVILQALTDEDVLALREQPPIREVLEFIQAVTEGKPNPALAV